MKPPPILSIADLHGHLGLFDAAVEQGRELAGRPDITVVTLGDYVDNGEQIPELLDRLIEFGEEHPGKFLPIAGNHDLACLLALGDRRKRFGDEAWWTRWRAHYANGTDLWTPSQYDAATLVEFRRNFPRRHWDFLAGLPWFERVGGYVFVHAGLKPGPIEQQLAELAARDLERYRESRLPEAIRNRERAQVHDRAWKAAVVSGHSKLPGGMDFLAPNRITLDSATCLGDPLHAVLLPARAPVGRVPSGRLFQVGESRPNIPVQGSEQKPSLASRDWYNKACERGRDRQEEGGKRG